MLSEWIPRLTHADNVGFSRKRTLGLAAAIALMCFAGAAAVGALFRAADAERSVNRTIEIRQEARDLLTIMLNAETGIRGFLLSGDETFLEPYRAAPRQLSATMEQLTALTADNPIQQQGLKRISYTTGQLMDFYRDLLALTVQGRRDGAIERITLKTGKTTMDGALRHLFGIGRDLRRLTQSRQIDLHSRSLVGLAVDADMAAGLLDESMHHGKPEAGALSMSLGCEEGLEDSLHQIRRNASSSVGDTECPSDALVPLQEGACPPTAPADQSRRCARLDAQS